MSVLGRTINELLRSRLRTDRHVLLSELHWQQGGCLTASVERTVSSTSETYGVAPTDVLTSGLTDLRMLKRTEVTVRRRRSDAQHQIAQLPADTTVTAMFFNVAVTEDDIVVYDGERYRPSIRGVPRAREAFLLAGESLEVSGVGLRDEMVLGCGLVVKPEGAITFTLEITDISGEDVTSDEITFGADCKLEDYTIVTVDGGRCIVADVTGTTLVSGTVGSGQIILSPDIPFSCQCDMRRLT